MGHVHISTAKKLDTRIFRLGPSTNLDTPEYFGAASGRVKMAKHN
jgi:hypothetical protein